MRIVGMVCVLNEEELLEEFFENNLQLVDLMVVAEGGVHGMPFKTSTGRSVDKTNYILDKYKAMYPDMIKIVRKDTPWNSKQEQQNSMLKYVNDDDWCFIFGTDELYIPDTRRKIENLIDVYPTATEITFPTVHFFGDDKHTITDKDFKSVYVIRREQRLFKYQMGMFYINHPTINDPSNRDIFFNEHYVDSKVNLGMGVEFQRLQYRSDLMGIWECGKDNIIYRFHYGFIRDIKSKVRKHIYYLMRDRGMKFDEAIDFLMDKTNNNPETIFGYIEQIHQHKKTTVSKCDYDHPLKGKKWNNSIINLKDIRREYKDFDENPSK